MTADRSISVLGGRALGGGSVINACDVVPAHAEVWRHFAHAHGLASWAPEAMAPFVARALDDLAATPIPEAMVNRNNRLLREGAQALGLAGEVMQHNRSGCLGLGTCLIGCPAGAKRNTRMVAIPKAIAASARVLVRARAVRIERRGPGELRLELRALDAQGYREVAAMQLQCRRAVVAAGPVGTVGLLRASGWGGPWLGRGLSLQPQVPVVARFADAVNAFEGIPQSYAVTAGERNDAERGLTGFRLEGIFGTPGILGSLVADPGVAGKEAMAALPFAAACLALVPDEPVGRIVRGWDGRTRIDYVLTDAWKIQAREAVRAAARCYLAAGAREVMVPGAPTLRLRSEAELAQIDGLAFAPASMPLLSAHQQGGACAAASAAQGVCRPDGEVWDAPGVFVCDGSLFPRTSSTHTMTPIMAMAHRVAAGMVAVG